MASQQEQDDFGAQCKAEAEITVAIDFDGVLYKVGGNPVHPELDVEPLPGTKEAIQAIHAKFPRLILHTCRAREDRSESSISHIQAWLEKYDLAQYFVEITAYKPRVTYYIDDKAVRHTSWDSTLTQMNIGTSWDTDSCQISKK